MKKIGFVDFYLSEWHANSYVGWIPEVTDEYKVCYAWAEEDKSPVDGVTTDEWCEKFGVEKCASIEELCEKSDVIVVLSPSNPEKHLKYAEAVLPYGKRTYIDKTFAPNSAEAQKIFAIAKESGTPFFSTSALRYATELDEVENCRRMVTTGSGSSVQEYIVHQIEMIVKKLGCGAAEVFACGNDEKFCSFRIAYPDDRSAMMLFASSMPFTVYMSGDKNVHTRLTSEYFKLLMADIVRFFNEGTASFDSEQTLEIMKIREGVLKALNTPETWVKL